MISEGEPIPDVGTWVPGEDGRPEPVRTGEVLGTGRVVLFAVPAAFSRGCSQVHLPGFINHADELTDKGVDRIACVAVNDSWVMGAWAQAQGADQILMLADANAEFTQAMGLDIDLSGLGMGLRSKRYAAVIEDGIVQHIDVDEKGGVEASAAEAVLERL